jgi:predicted double-glycine peptidase
MKAISASGKLGRILLIAFMAPAMIRAQTVAHLNELKPDKACGPRALLALVRTTGVGRQDCTLKSIYEIIGKEPLTATSLKDLVYAAESLGFRAQGYRLSSDALRKKEGYAIVPLALDTTGQGGLLHFVLVKEIGQEYVTIINARTLETKAVSLGEFERVWNGYAVVIFSRDPGTPLPKPPDDFIPGQEISAGPCDVTWDFGLADNGVLLEHTFVIDLKGTGRDEVEIIGKSCTCVDAQLGRDTEGNACVTVKLRVKQAGPQQADVKLRLSGGEVKRYGVKAFGRAMFVVHPDKGYVRMPQVGEIAYPVEVYYYADANDFIEFSHIRTSIPNLQTGSVTRQSETLPNGAVRHKFTIPLVYRLESELPEIVVTRKTVQFAFDTSAGQKLVPLEMIIKAGAERVKLFPQRLFLLVSASDEPPRRQVRLEFASDEASPDEVLARVGDLPLVVRSSLIGNAYTAEVRVDRGAIENHPASVERGTISFVPLENGKSADPIELPVTLLIRK